VKLFVTTLNKGQRKTAGKSFTLGAEQE